MGADGGLGGAGGTGSPGSALSPAGLGGGAGGTGGNAGAGGAGGIGGAAGFGTGGRNGADGIGGNAGSAGRGGPGGRGGTGADGTAIPNVNVAFLANTANQSPGSLSVSGFQVGDTLLVGVSLNNAPAGTTFQFGSTAGLTPGFGYTFTSTMQQISFTGTQAATNAALATMLVSTGATTGGFAINVTATVNVSGTYYYGPNNHYYRYVPNLGITWTNALAGAATFTYNGATGYLVNITNAAENDFIRSNVDAGNIWIGATDEANEGTWLWAAGPEAGTVFWVGDFTGSTVPPLNYASWAPNEPNNAGNEDYAVTNWQGSRGFWNDLVDNPPAQLRASGYLVEFSPPQGGYTGVSTQLTTAAVTGFPFGGNGGPGGPGGPGGNGALGGSGGGQSSPGGQGGTGGLGGKGGDGGAIGNPGGSGGSGGTGGTGGTGPAAGGLSGSTGSAGNSAVGPIGGLGGAGGTGGSGGAA